MKKIQSWIEYLASRKKRAFLGVVRLLPISSKHFGPPKGFYWTFDQYIERTLDRLSFSANVYPMEIVNLSPPEMVHGRAFCPDTLVYQADAYKFYSIHKGRFHSNGRAVITRDDRLLVVGSAWMGPSPLDNLVFTRFRLGRVKYLEGRTFFLGGWNNYYHFLTEDLTNFVALEKLGQSWKNFDHVLVSRPSKPFQKELLGLMGIPQEKTRYLQEQDHVECEQLCFASAHHYLTRRHIECMRKFFDRTISGAYPASGLRLYVSRSNTRGGIENEGEVWHLLNDRGFHRVILEEESIATQVRLFRSAVSVVAAHGAGLTNVVFMPEGGKVLELRNPLFQAYTADAYFRLSALSAHVYAAFFCTPSDHKLSQSDPAQSWAERPRPLYVDISIFGRFLDNFLRL